MNMADSDAAGAAPAEAPSRPSQTSLDALAANPIDPLPAIADGADRVARADLAMPPGCPFLVAETGGWRLDVPSRDHRCAAVSPPAALTPEKQTRLCLTAAHTHCATYLASMSAREVRVGAPVLPVTERSTRWGLARTTTVIEDAGGLRSRLVGLVLDRGRWPAIPAVLLVVTLLVLAISGLRGGGVVPVATASPTRPATTPAATVRPSGPPLAAPTTSAEPGASPSGAPTVAPSAAPTTPPGTAATYRTYKVKSGDTLSGIASDFGTTSRAIADLNGISVGSTLHVGQTLKIPNP